MWESDEQSIHYLKKAYFIDLPRRIDEAGEGLERSRLIEEQRKIGCLLEFGYRVPLTPPPSGQADAAINSESVWKLGRNQAERAREFSRNMGQTKLRRPSIGIEKELRQPVHRQASDKEKEVTPVEVIHERQRVNKNENAAAVAKLRKEYFEEIPEKLAVAVSEQEKRLLADRRIKIGILLERGYRISLKTG